MGLTLRNALYFKIPLRAVPKGNSRPICKNSKTGKFFIGKPRNLLQYEADALLILNAQKNKIGLKSITTMIKAEFRFNFKSVCRADGDNLVKCLKDLLQKSGIVVNDRIIKDVHYRVYEKCTEDSTEIFLWSEDVNVATIETARLFKDT